MKKGNKLGRKSARKLVEEKLNKVEFTTMKKNKMSYRENGRMTPTEVRKIKKIFLIMFRGV